MFCFFAAFKLVATIFSNFRDSASPLGDLAHTFILLLNTSLFLQNNILSQIDW